MNESRILITGWPRSGKTSFADKMFNGHVIYHTDKLIPTHNDEQMSRVVCEWLKRSGPWVVEGIAVVSGLKLFCDECGGKPCDTLYWFYAPLVPLTKGQLNQGKRLTVAMISWLQQELSRRKVNIIRHCINDPAATVS